MAWNEEKIRQERKERRGYWRRDISQAIKERVLELSETTPVVKIAESCGISTYTVRQIIKTAPKNMLPPKMRPEAKEQEKYFNWDDYDKDFAGFI